MTLNCPFDHFQWACDSVRTENRGEPGWWVGLFFLKCVVYFCLFPMMDSLDESSSLWVYKKLGGGARTWSPACVQMVMRPVLFPHAAVQPVKSRTVFWLVLTPPPLTLCLPTSKHHRRIRAFSNESSLWFSSKSPCSSSISLALPCAHFIFLVSSSPLLCRHPHPSCNSLLIPLNSASFEEVRLLSA